ncbi:MAG: flagellar protein [Clostridiales bacterium]|nr:flagellar protein [Clostridiales bacterium]
MEDLRIRYYTPVTTGTPHVTRPSQPQQPKETEEKTVENPSFREALEAQLQQTSNVSFSKHAVNRAIQRNLDLSEDNIARLNEGVRLAKEKKLEDPLILVDRTAFLVNIKHHRVITTVDAEELKGNVFTNIDGTVII